MTGRGMTTRPAEVERLFPKRPFGGDGWGHVGFWLRLQLNPKGAPDPALDNRQPP